MLFILKEKVYGILRGNQIYKFDLRFPRKRNVHETLNHTLLDGIMVMDKDEHNNMVPRYLAFDLLFLEVCFFLKKDNGIKIEIEM